MYVTAKVMKYCKHIPVLFLLVTTFTTGQHLSATIDVHGDIQQQTYFTAAGSSMKSTMKSTVQTLGDSKQHAMIRTESHIQVSQQPTLTKKAGAQATRLSTADSKSTEAGRLDVGEEQNDTENEVEKWVRSIDMKLCQTFSYLVIGILAFGIAYMWLLYHKGAAINPQILAEQQDSSSKEYESDKHHRWKRFVAMWIVLSSLLVGFSPPTVIHALLRPQMITASVRHCHKFFAVVWFLILVHQTVTAYFGRLGSQTTPNLQQQPLRAYTHRFLGYLGVPLGLIACISGVLVMPTTKGFFEDVVFGSVGIFAILNLIAGIFHVRRKDIAEHKQCMGWVVVWSAGPGLIRMTPKMLAWGAEVALVFLVQEGGGHTLCNPRQNPPAYCIEHTYYNTLHFLYKMCGMTCWSFCLSTAAMMIAGAFLGRRWGECWKVHLPNQLMLGFFTVAFFPPLTKQVLFALFGEQIYHSCLG